MSNKKYKIILLFQICGKTLKCGQPSHPHLCKEKCHDGPCPSCPLTTLVRCRCGHMDKEIECTALTSKADDARCGKKCTKVSRIFFLSFFAQKIFFVLANV